MPINRVYLENFRLFKKKDLNLSEEKNIILGLNGSGKTSILESIELMNNGKSFRTTASKDCINHNSDTFRASLKGTCLGQELSINGSNRLEGKLTFSRKLNNKALKRGGGFFLQTVLAKNLRMIEGEPGLRREHINKLMFHVKPSSYKLFLSYNKALKQRNRCLKQKLQKSEISAWTEQLAAIGVSLSKEQYEFFYTFKDLLIKNLTNFSKTKNFKFLKEVDIKFNKGWQRSKSLLGSLQESIEKDIVIGYTSQGPHRMDCEYYIKGKRASSTLSRGQLKVLILLIFLVNHDLLNLYKNSEVILLIDDLGAELDTRHLEAVLSEISQSPNQTVLTGIRGEDLDKIVSKFSNFKRINL